MDTEMRLLSLSLHVYRIGWILGDDKIIRAEDRKTPRYFLKGTGRLPTSWKSSLYAGADQNGILLCHIRSPYVGPPVVEIDPGPIRIVFCSPQGLVERVVEVHRNAPVGTYSFKGLDDQRYRWQPDSGLWGNNKMKCLNSQDEVVATYRITAFALSKDGELRIHQPALDMADLVVATCLAMRMPDH